MIELYVGLRPSASDTDELLDEAERNARRRDSKAALRLTLSALLNTQAREESYSRAATLAYQLYLDLGCAREALSLAWYLQNQRLSKALLENVKVSDRARTLQSFAAKEPKLYSEASALFEADGRLTRAAIAHERAGSWERARTLWSRLSDELDRREANQYAGGLARFNVSRASQKLGDLRTASEAATQAVTRLEEAATVFESIGQRERAFDCYSVLIPIGQLTQTFEHVLVGSLDSIRILREDNLSHHALRAYEELLDRAATAGDYAALASVAREFGSYAAQHGFETAARDGAQREADAWERASAELETHNAPAELIENALRAAIRCRAELGEYRDVLRLFERLAERSSEPARKEHYLQAAQRYQTAPEAPRRKPEVARPIRAELTLPDVWHIDLLEWENRGSVAEACADILLEPAFASDRITTRGALLARLVALSAEAPNVADPASALATLADFVSRIGVYNLLSPLEKLAVHPLAAVRRAAISALSRFFFKRSFVTLESALSDSDDAVVSEATRAIGRLRFDHAFEPLSRIYRNAKRADARLAALSSLARLELVESAELVLSVLEHGTSEEQDVVVEALRTAAARKFVELARTQYPHASPQLKRRLSEILRQHGERLLE